MNVLSICDGISCGQVALQRAGITDYTYYASEIDLHAIKVTQSNFPDTIQLGDCRSIDLESLPHIDILYGATPCQDVSTMKQGAAGLNGENSRLFFDFIRILEKVNPDIFIYENVASMSNDTKDMISSNFCLSPYKIDSACVSAQQRRRYYWTNIDFQLPGYWNAPVLQDILESGYAEIEKAYCLIASEGRTSTYPSKLLERYKKKFITVVFDSPDFNEERIRRFTQMELERLQTLPEGYTRAVKRNKAAELIGNAWTVDVIAHILHHRAKRLKKRVQEQFAFAV